MVDATADSSPIADTLDGVMSQPLKHKTSGEWRQSTVANAFSASITRVRSAQRRPAKILIMSLLAAGAVLVLTFVRQFFASTQVAYAWGDGAVLEMYTIHASRGLWELGPYSRFGWHHPGPFLFYALAPMYALSGWHAFGLNAGALVINVGAVFGIAWAAARWANPVTGCAILVAVAVYLFRLGGMAISYWNPHVIVLPFGAFVLLCAGMSAGRASTLPAVMSVGSFLAQTHLSLAPTVAALASVSLIGLFTSRLSDRSGHASAPTRNAGTWVAASIGVLALLWCLPLMEQVSAHPGNLSRLIHFFAEPYDGQPWTIATLAWGDAISALFSRDLRIPTGANIQPGGSGLMPALAIVQLLLLIVAWRDANRRADRFQAFLCVIGAVASLAALLSILRIRMVIGEYMVFWISLLGTLNWAVLTGVAVLRLQPSLHGVRNRVPGMLAVVVVAGFVVGQVEHFRRNSRQPLEETAQKVGVLAEALLAHLQRAGLERPLVRVSPTVWSEGAGVVVRLYKLGLAVSVEPEQVNFFGQPLAPSGNEDSAFHIVDAATHAELSKRDGDLVIASYGAVYVHADTGLLNGRRSVQARR